MFTRSTPALCWNVRFHSGMISDFTLRCRWIVTHLTYYLPFIEHVRSLLLVHEAGEDLAYSCGLESLCHTQVLCGWGSRTDPHLYRWGGQRPGYSCRPIAQGRCVVDRGFCCCSAALMRRWRSERGTSSDRKMSQLFRTSCITRQTDVHVHRPVRVLRSGTPGLTAECAHREQSANRCTARQHHTVAGEDSWWPCKHCGVLPRS